MYDINKRIALHSFLYDVITHQGPHLNNTLAKALSQLWHGWIITSHSKILNWITYSFPNLRQIMLVEDTPGNIFSSTDNKCFSMTAPRHSACIMHCARNWEGNQRRNMRANLNYSPVITPRGLEMQIWIIILNHCWFGKWLHVFQHIRISYRNSDLLSFCKIAMFVNDPSMAHVPRFILGQRAT